eukprot:scaffold244_cov172-Amphora_coffeaeformis.AAC.35
MFQRRIQFHSQVVPFKKVLPPFKGGRFREALVVDVWEISIGVCAGRHIASSNMNSNLQGRVSWFYFCWATRESAVYFLEHRRWAHDFELRRPSKCINKVLMVGACPRKKSAAFMSRSGDAFLVSRYRRLLPALLVLDSARPCLRSSWAKILAILHRQNSLTLPSWWSRRRLYFLMSCSYWNRMPVSIASSSLHKETQKREKARKNVTVSTPITDRFKCLKSA